MFRSRWWLICAALALGSTLWATPPLTTIEDVLYSSDGTRFNGLITIAWPSFEASDTSDIAAGTLQLQITSGILYVQLVPTSNAITPGIYTVQYNSNNGTLYTEAWAVPPSTVSLVVADVRVAPGTVTGSAPTPTFPPSSGSSTPPSNLTSITISEVTGLQSALNIRPIEGTGFTISRAAIIDSTGAIDGAIGNLSDCLHVDGSSGSCGSAGGSPGFIDAEVPSGAVNGSNSSFSLANVPSPGASLELFRNGLLMDQGGDYTLTNNSVNFLAGSVPQSGDVLLASYRLNVTIPNVGFVDQETPSGTINGVNASFTSSQVPTPSTSLLFFRNGLRLTPGIDYTLSGSSISFLSGQVPQTGDVLLCSYRIAD
jgi:hypothetical protein